SLLLALLMTGLAVWGFLAQREAETERNKANAEKERAERQRDRAEGLVYAGNLLQAQLFWDAANVVEANKRLDACRWDLRGWEHSHLRRQFNETCVTLEGHAEAVTSVGFSPNGKRIVTGSRDKTAKLWDADSGRKIRTLRGHTQAVDSVCFSPDGKHILTG